jgi:hypothetical protein
MKTYSNDYVQFHCSIHILNDSYLGKKTVNNLKPFLTKVSGKNEYLKENSAGTSVILLPLCTKITLKIVSENSR